MFEEFSRRNRAVMAAMSLAAVYDWGDITLSDIAKEGNLSLADLRRDFSCKSDLLSAFQTEVDAQVLARLKNNDPDSSVRDRLFEALMTRFEIMLPYKPALKRIWEHMRCRPSEASLFACSRLVSEYWMLAASGAKLEGVRGIARTAGLAAVHGMAFKTWLEDDSASMDKTMATLDRGLNNGDKAMASVDKACQTVCGLVRGLKQNLAKGKPEGDAAPDPEPAPPSV